MGKSKKKKNKEEVKKVSKYSFYQDYYLNDYDDDEVSDYSYGKRDKVTTPSTTPTTTTPKYGSYYGGYYSGGYGSYGGYSGYSSGYGSYYGSSYYGRSSYEPVSYYGRYKSSFGGYSLGASTGGKSFADTASLMIKAYKEARDLVIILDFPFTVEISFAKYDGVDANSRFIFLETEVLDSPTYTAEEKINILCGLAVHEACHLKYTSWQVSDKFYWALEAGSKLEGVSEEDTSSVNRTNGTFLKLVFNLIEDMRVEHELLGERPGYSSILQTEKDYRFKQYQDINLEKSSLLSETSRELFDTLVRLIRFPDEVEESKVEKYSDVYEKLRVTMSPLPKSTKESCIVAVRMFKVLKDYFDFNGLVDFDKCARVFANLAESYSVFPSIYAGYDSSESVSAVKRRMLNRCSTDLSSRTAASVVTGHADVSKTSSSTYFFKPEGGELSYKKSAESISKYVPAMRKIIFGYDKNYEFVIQGCRAGLLDTTKLAEAYQGVPQVYIRKGKVETNKVAVCVLIDESGSMGWGLDDIARDAAILLNEALKDSPGVELFIYGHTADENFNGSTEIYVYREGDTYCPKYALGTSHARDENRDGTAIKQVAQRVMEKTKNKIIMLVLSDGDPSAFDYRGMSAVNDTSKNVKEVEKMGVQVIQITIGPVKNVSRMFSKSIDLQFDLSALPIELSKVVKKVIIDNKETTVS